MIEWTDILIRLVTAAVFGGLVGLERERKNWTAGLRTHMMVCTGSALIMIVSSYGFSEIIQQGYADLDPSRVAAQVVSGIRPVGDLCALAGIAQDPGNALGCDFR